MACGFEGNRDVDVFRTNSAVEHPYTYITPFPSLIITPRGHLGSISGNFLGFGGCAFVLSLHTAIAFKFPILFDIGDDFDKIMGKTRLLDDGENSSPLTPEESAKVWRDHLRSTTQSSRDDVRWESEVAKRLEEWLRLRPCLHISRPFLITPEGIFQKRFKYNLAQRLQGRYQDDVTSWPGGAGSLQSVSLRTRLHWARQLASAVAWLERAGLCHGDLRPPNIMLDEFDNLALIDFGASRDIGEQVRGGGAIYCPRYFEVGGPASEGFAAGCTFYFIFNGYIPYDFDVDEAPNVKWPRMEPDDVFYSIIKDCWNRKFASLADLQAAVDAEYQRLQPWYYRVLDSLNLQCDALWTRLSRPYYQSLSRRLYRQLQTSPAPDVGADDLEKAAAAVRLQRGWLP